MLFSPSPSHSPFKISNCHWMAIFSSKYMNNMINKHSGRLVNGQMTPELNCHQHTGVLECLAGNVLYTSTIALKLAQTVNTTEEKRSQRPRNNFSTHCEISTENHALSRRSIHPSTESLFETDCWKAFQFVNQKRAETVLCSRTRLLTPYDHGQRRPKLNH